MDRAKTTGFRRAFIHDILLIIMEYTLKAPIIFERVKQLDCFSLPLESLSNDDTIIFDLSPVRFIKPSALIGILVIIEGLLKMPAGPVSKLVVFPPEKQDVLDYLIKVDFPKALQSLCAWEIPKEHQIAPTPRVRPVIPITRFLNSNGVEEIANLMQQTFRTGLVGLSTLLQPCHIVFSELADNIIHHAKSNGGFVLAQQYNYTKGPMLEIAIGDCGIGIPGSLRQHHCANDQEAILLAFQDGITCVSDPHRGFGLGYVQEEVRSIENRSLTVRSGTGYAIIRGGGYTFSGKCEFLPGTLAHFVIPCG